MRSLVYLLEDWLIAIVASSTVWRKELGCLRRVILSRDRPVIEVLRLSEDVWSCGIPDEFIIDDIDQCNLAGHLLPVNWGVRDTEWTEIPVRKGAEGAMWGIIGNLQPSIFLFIDSQVSKLRMKHVNVDILIIPLRSLLSDEGHVRAEMRAAIQRGGFVVSVASGSSCILDRGRHRVVHIFSPSAALHRTRSTGRTVEGWFAVYRVFCLQHDVIYGECQHFQLTNF